MSLPKLIFFRVHFVFALALLFLASPVWAIPVTWTFENVSMELRLDAEDALSGDTFRDGRWYRADGWLNGSFVYDADTNTFSDIDIQTFDASGSLFSYYNMSFPTEPTVQWASPDRVFLNGFFADGRPQNWMDLSFATNLTNSGGAVAIEWLFEDLGYTFREAAPGGSIQASVVPVPAAVWLFGSALASFGWCRRKPAT